MPGFDDIFGGFDDIVDENDKNDAKEDEWDTGADNGVWDSGEKENIWRTSAPAAPGDVFDTKDVTDPCAGGGCDSDCDVGEDCEEAEAPLRGGGDPTAEEAAEEVPGVSPEVQEEEKSEYDQMDEYDTQYAEDDDGEDEYPPSVFDDI